MKSIRKDDVEVTADELGVKEGDKFIVLCPEDSHDKEVFAEDYCCVGDVIVLAYDDNTECPQFKNTRTGERFYESFSCRARHEGASKEAIEFQFVSRYADWEEIGTGVIVFYDATLLTDVFPWSNPEDCYVVAISTDECFVEVSDKDGNVVENRKFKVSLI